MSIRIFASCKHSDHSIRIFAYGNQYTHRESTLQPCSALVEGDEQLDRPNSQITMELYHACVA